MGSDWYVEQDGKEYGPYSSAQLKSLAEAGGVSPNAIVTGGGKRERAHTVPWLFDKLAEPPADDFVSAGPVHASAGVGAQGSPGNWSGSSPVGSANFSASASVPKSLVREKRAQKDELPLATGTVHPAVFIPACILGGLFLFVFGMDLKGIAGNLLLVVVGLAMLAMAVWATLQVKLTQCVIKMDRIVGRKSWPQRERLDLPMYNVDGLDAQQGFWGRLLGFGTIVVLHTDGKRTSFPFIANPHTFVAVLK